jgi:hypothetical protein
MAHSIEEIITIYNSVVDNSLEALKNAGVSKNIAALYLYQKPKISKLSPQNAILLYDEIRKQIILHLHTFGFSQREIARRLGGGCYHIVTETLQVNNKKNESTGKKI